MDILEGKKVLTKDGQLHNVSHLLKSKKIIIYYFSASWVQTSVLTEKLKYIYEENLKRNLGMEIIYVSSDTDEKIFRHDYIEHHGAWAAIPFKGIIADELRWMYDITCLPQLVVVKKDGEIITRRGKEELEKLGINVLVTWTDYIQ
ncbi:hypothetical protein NQ314_000514 [Rhamnusium bicolor]|uniref:Thioredoxin-like fold domain-containing protein n=1 Tax=Rhamnusium bicolor TaxID=1586634 RepID=A0AAV8ZUL4_9CUCU|nr:hypothetical protein NQ314_000514 [Rhamnusium bicolor]